MKRQILNYLLILPDPINIRSARWVSDHEDPSYTLAILRSCKKINLEATPILYGCNEFAITLCTSPCNKHPSYLSQNPTTDTSFSNTATENPSNFKLQKFRWSTIPLFTSLTFSSGTTNRQQQQNIDPKRPSFTCTGREIMTCFSPYDQMYSQTGPDEYMALSVMNWISTKVMKAELMNFQLELETWMASSLDVVDP